MATVSKLNFPTKPSKLVDGLPLPQACLGEPSVRSLLHTGQVLRLTKNWKDPDRLSEATYRLRETEERLLSHLPEAVWYGAFHLLGKAKLDGRLRYAVACVCGSEYILDTEQLVEALLNHTGCRRDCCQQPVLLKLFWGTLADSLQVQWRLLQACHPERLPSYWGGTLDEVYERDMRFGFVRAYQEMLKFKVDLSRPDRRWITPLNPGLPYTQDNLELRTTPWAPVARLNKLAIVIAGQPLPLTELCENLNVSIAQVLDTLVTDGVSPDELVMALLQKGAAT